MDARIGHVHGRYRVYGSGASRARIPTEHRGALERAAVVCGEALDEVYGRDPTVYVVRRVASRVTLDSRNADAESLAVRRWGERLAGVVVRSIAGGQTENVVRFADHGDYVAQFLCDLVRGEAWNRWFYGAFAEFRDKPKADAVRAALTQHHQHLPSILAGLRERRVLEAVLELLDGKTLRGLWAPTARSTLAEDTGVEALVSVAFGVVGRLCLWRQSAPALAVVAREVEALGLQPVDWRDVAALARACGAVIRHLGSSGRLRNVSPVDHDAWLAGLEAAAREIDWLDTGIVWAAVIEAIEGPPAPASSRAARATPRQQRLLRDLQEALRHLDRPLDVHSRGGAANAVRWYAALVALRPEWRDDTTVRALVQTLLDAWEALGDMAMPSDDGGAFLDVRENGVDQLPRLAGARSNARRLRRLMTLGNPAAVVLRSLAEDAHQAEQGMGTRCAGAFFLLRALVDLRVQAAATASGSPDAGDLMIAHPLVLAVLRQCAGEVASVGGRLDPGLAALVGARHELVADQVQTLASGNGACFVEALFRTAVEQRLVARAAMRLHSLPVGSRRLLVAGDASDRLWPLGATFGEAGEIREIAAKWLVLWQAGGSTPEQITVDARIAPALSGLAPHIPVVAVDEGRTSEQHARSRAALVEAMGAFAPHSAPLAEHDALVALAAGLILRAWARWLRQFADSSVPYLLAQFVRRPGRVSCTSEEITVAFAPGPLDIVLDMSGYTSRLEGASWFGRKSVRFRAEGA